MGRFLVTLSIASLASGFAFAGGAGTVSGEFLGISSSTRASGMGEAFTAVGEDIGGIYHNPAGIAQVHDLGVNYVHAFWMESINYDYLSATAPLGMFGTAGFSFTRLYLEGEKVVLGADGEPVTAPGLFSASDMAVGLTYAFSPTKMTSVGATAKFITQDLSLASAQSAAMDVGVYYKTPLPQLATGLVVTNVGSKLEGESLPVLLKAGVAYTLPPVRGLAARISKKDRWDVPLVTADVHFQLQPQMENFYRARLGLEYAMALGAGHALCLRGGYKFGEDGPAGMYGATFGAGYRWTVKRFLMSMDYAWVNYGDLGVTHRIALTTNFLHLAEVSLGTAEERRKLEAKREGQVFIQWPPSADPQVVGYNVYVGESRDGNFAKVNTGPISGTSISVKGLKVGKTYFFFATTVVGVSPSVEGRPFFETAAQATPIP